MELTEKEIPKITVPLVMTSYDITTLYDEIENSDNSILTEFITNLLKKVDLYAMWQLKNAQEILKVNPFSKKRGIKNEML